MGDSLVQQLNDSVFVQQSFLKMARHFHAAYYRPVDNLKMFSIDVSPCDKHSKDTVSKSPFNYTQYD